MPHNLRIISWNTAHRLRKAPQQAAALLERVPDVVVLQEVTASTLSRLLPLLASAGVGYAVFTSQPGRSDSRARALCVAVASRYPVKKLEIPGLQIPWPEKVLPVSVTFPGREVHIFGAHIPPGSSNGWTKIETFEGLFSGLSRRASTPRILCGDFNSPQIELPNGQFVSWAQRLRPDGTVRTMQRIRGGDGTRWDAAERSVLRGLEAFGFRDAFRHLHGNTPGFSFALKRKTSVVHRRFDHLLVSDGFRVKSCRYVHEWREAGLSDHAAIEADLTLD